MVNKALTTVLLQPPFESRGPNIKGCHIPLQTRFLSSLSHLLPVCPLPGPEPRSQPKAGLLLNQALPVPK